MKDTDGTITEVHARIIPNTLGENPEDGIKPKGVIQWVSATEGKQAEVRVYDRLFNHEAPDRGDSLSFRGWRTAKAIACMPPVRKRIPVSTKSAPMIFSTVPKWRRKRAKKFMNAGANRAANKNGTPRPAE